MSCKLILVALLISACPQEPPVLPAKDNEEQFELGQYSLAPQKQPAEFADLDPVYRLVSFQSSGYWLSSDTGLSYVVSGTGQVTQIKEVDLNDNIDPASHVRVYATANGESWQLQDTTINHSLAVDAKEVPSAVRVLWIGEKTMLAYGQYQLKGGKGGTGIQVIRLNENNQIDITAIRLTEKFVDADTYIAGGLADGGQRFWLWTRKGGLLVANYDEEKNTFGYEERITIDLPKLAVTVKDFGFSLTIADGTILPPDYVLAITSQNENRGAVYIAHATD